jgi:signal transduction histidine kinase
MIENKEIMGIADINEATVAWRKMTFLLKDLQSKVITVKKVDELIQTLLDADLQLDDTEELSIIYHHEGSDAATFLAYQGRVFPNESVTTAKYCFTADNPAISTVIKQKKQGITYFSNQKACAKAGFTDYKSVLILPMTFNESKNVGAFVLHHPHQENAYGNEIQAVWKVLSEQIAFFIRTHVRIQYNQIFDNVRHDLLTHHFDQEYDLIAAVVDYIKRWYSDDDIYVLIKNTMNLDSYYLACDKGVVKKDFRCAGVMDEMQINAIVGGESIIEQLETQHEMVISPPELVSKGTGGSCCSWLGASFYHPSEYNLGFIILHNRETENAYALGADAFLDRIADFTALLLADYRSRKKNDFIKEVHDFRINNKDDETALYQKIYTFLHQAYGINSLAIAKVNRVTQLVEPVFNEGETEIDFDKTLQNIAIQHAETLRNDVSTNAEKLTIWHEKHQQCYLIAPMRTGSEDNNLKVIGCFVIPVTKAGSISARVINRLSDALATELNEIDRQKRNDTLNQFGKRVSQLATVGLTQDKILEIAHQYIERAMFTENLYIALYDQENISFPLIQRDGKEWPEETKPQSRRLNTEQQGKTEAIIIDRKPILHLTNAESKAWYTDPKHPERQEFVDDYLASWIGVPIFYNDHVVGVIATYHPKVDYVYSQADVFFLQNVAHQVSRLLLTLELSNNQAKIAEQQHILSTSLLAQDLTHRLNNSIGAMVIDVKQAYRDIQSAIKFKDTRNLEFTLEGLKDTETMLQELIKETKEISDDSTQCIHLNVLLEKIAKQVRIGKRLDDISVNITLDIALDLVEISAHYRTLFNSLYAIVDNAADALVTQYHDDNSDDALFLSISAQQHEGVITLRIEDNGVLVPSMIKNEIFEHGISSKSASGFGLWRSQAVIKSLNGTLHFLQYPQERIKRFTINLPIVNDLSAHKRAYVLDDERTWRNIVKRWLIEDDFKVDAVDNKAALLMLLEQENGSPSHVFLDISLDKVDGSNRDGLSLIKEVARCAPKAKIILVTGYAKFADAYTGMYDTLIEKVTTDTGEVLSKKRFLQQVHEDSKEYS